jgi:hypothetical protein
VSMKVAMYKEARELLGRGYVPEYYEQAASGFIQIADCHIGDLKNALVEALCWVPDRSKRSPVKRGANCKTVEEMREMARKALCL